MRVTVRRRGFIDAMAWRADDGAEIIVVSLDGGGVRRFRADAFMLEHVVNAWEEDGKIFIDYTHYATSRALEDWASTVASGDVRAPMRCAVRRATIDPAKETLSTEVLIDRALELPRVSPRVESRRHRFSYYAGFSPGAELGHFDTLVKHDAERGALDAYAPGAGQYPGEAVFVPRAAATAEDDGWLLSLVYDAPADRSRLEILDARVPANGPVAACHFDHAIPFGFHGAWAPETAPGS